MTPAHETAYEADGVQFTVTPAPADAENDPLPALAWAVAHAKRENFPGPTIAGTTNILDGAAIEVSFAPRSLAAGLYRIQIRTGASEAAARTLDDIFFEVRPSLQPA